VAGKLLKFLLIPVYTTYLLPSEYGILSLCLLYAGFAAVFCFWGVNSAFFRYFVPQEREGDSSDSFGNVFLLVTIFSLLVFSLSYLFSRSLSTFLLGRASQANLTHSSGFMLSQSKRSSILRYSSFSILFRY